MAQPKMTNVGGGAASGTPMGNSYPTATGPGMGSTGTGMGQVPNYGNLYGYTTGLSETDIDAGLSYAPRILEQVMGGSLSPLTRGAMAPWTDLASNPIMHQLLNPAYAGLQMGDAPPTLSDMYNFQANFMKNAMTPGRGTPTFGGAMDSLMSGLRDPNSVLYHMLMGLAGEGEGGGNVGSMTNVINELIKVIDPFLGYTAPGARQAYGNVLANSADQFLRDFQLRPGQQAPNPIPYILSSLGLGGGIPAYQMDPLSQ